MKAEVSIPAPDRWHRGADEHDHDVSVPVWSSDVLGEITPWTDGVTIGEDYLEDVTAEGLRQAAGMLLAVAEHLRARDG